MRVPDEVRQCVDFIGLDDGAYGGTGFFVQVASPSINGMAYTYFVTARHVADKIVNRDFVVRMNQIDGRPAIPIQNQRGSTRWWLHPTEHTDIAAMPLQPDPSRIEWKGIPESMFATDQAIKDFSLGVGDEVFITGLFRKVTGDQRNILIVRMGNMAMMPGEQVPTRMGNMDGYLIEARSIGGISGSPVFIRETIILPVKPKPEQPPEMPPYITGSGRYFLLGLMHGHWDLPPDAVNQDSLGDDENGKVNMGIAIVIPATKILETLYQPELLEMREQGDKKTRGENLPTMDDVFPLPGRKTRDVQVVEHPDKAKFFDDLGKAIRKREKK